MVSYTACLDELRKIAACKDRMTVPQSRSGRRSMSAETMLRKDKEGTLFKKDAALSSSLPSSTSGDVVLVGRPASAKSRPGDAPSLDEPNTYPKTEQTQTNRSTTALSPALDAQKMASMRSAIGQLVFPKREQFPTVDGDPTNRRDRSIATHINTLAPNPEEKVPAPWEGPA